VEFSQLSQRDPNPLGEKALAIHPEQWKHAETDHFHLSFRSQLRRWESGDGREFHYRVVVKELERDQPATDTKIQYLHFRAARGFGRNFRFSANWNGDRWDSLAGQPLHPTQSALQIFRKRAWTTRIVHLVIHRFYPEGIPCLGKRRNRTIHFKNAHASYQRARGYIAKRIRNPSLQTN